MKSNRAGYNREFAAVVLIAAVYGSDETACAKYGITTRTLQNYRRRLVSDTQLSEVFATKKAELDEAWAEDFVLPLKAGARFVAEAIDAVRADPNYRKNPVVITAVAEALRLCADVLLTSKAINAQFSNQDKPQDRLPEEVSPAIQVEYSN